MPLYDSLGENAVEYIVNHAGVELVFIDVAKLPEFVKVTACSSCSCQDTTIPLHAVSGTAAQLAPPTCAHEVSHILQHDGGNVFGMPMLAVDRPGTEKLLRMGRCCPS